MPDWPKIPPDDRTRAPEDEEWPGVWDAVQKSNDAWMVVAPFVAVVKNWKALAVVLTITLALNGARILEILENYLGVSQ